MSSGMRDRAWLYPLVATVVAGLSVVPVVGVEHGVVADLHWSLVAIALAVAQVSQIHVTTDRGRHTVSPTEGVLAVALLTHTPAALLVGTVVSAVPLLLRSRPSPLKYAVNLSHTLVWTAVPALVFHLVVPADATLGPRAVLGALGVAVLAFVGSAATIRIPIGLATGAWRLPPGELAGLVASAAIATAAASVAVSAVALATAHWSYVLLLLVPVIELLRGLRQRARTEEARRALAFVVRATEGLRATGDVRDELARTLVGMRDAFDATEAVLVVPHPESTVRLTASGEGVQDTVRDVHEEALRQWLQVDQPEGAVTDRSPDAGTLGSSLDGATFLAVPLRTVAGYGAIVLLHRPIGPFPATHVELASTVGDAVTSAVERATLSTELDAAGRREAELERRASHDAMTGLVNRERFERELTGALATDGRTTVVYIDLTGFKAINDTHGHLVGDQVLIEAARRIRDATRPEDVVARLGGDEFAVLLRDGSGERGVLVGERVLDALEAPVSDAVPTLRAGIGVATAQAGDTIATLVERADAAMYRSKQDGSRHVHEAARRAGERR